MAFNSRQYTFCEMKMFAFGRFFRIAELKYGPKINKEFLHGNEQDPFSIQHGQKTYQGTVSFFQSDFQALINSANGVDILELSFDIVVTYKPKNATGPVITKTIKLAEFSEFEEGMSDGDTHMKVTLPFMFLRLEG